MKNHNLKIFIIAFLAFFFAIVAICKFTGFTNRFSSAYNESLSWYEVYLEIPKIIIGSLVAGFFSTIFYKNAERMDKKNINDARKRVEEREIKEKNQKKK
jgi:hypothetical protein